MLALVWATIAPVERAGVDVCPRVTDAVACSTPVVLNAQGRIDIGCHWRAIRSAISTTLYPPEMCVLCYRLQSSLNGGVDIFNSSQSAARPMTEPSRLGMALIFFTCSFIWLCRRVHLCCYTTALYQWQNSRTSPFMEDAILVEKLQQTPRLGSIPLFPTYSVEEILHERVAVRANVRSRFACDSNFVCRVPGGTALVFV